jgi:hypothetical protein
MKPMVPSVTVDRRADADGSRCFVVKVGTDWYEVNLTIPEREAPKLKQVPTTPWVGGSLRIGESAGLPAFWSVDDQGRVGILLGHDDETWDIGLLFPREAFDAIITEVESLSKSRDSA